MKRRKLGWQYALVVIGLVVMSLLVIDFNSRMAELRGLRNQQDLVAAELTSLVRTQEQLQTQLSYATSDAAVLEWAYQDERLKREGDIPIVPLAPEEATPVPTPRVVVTPTPESNLEIWLSLFLDRRAP
jgi:hypothetical protein